MLQFDWTPNVNAGSFMYTYIPPKTESKHLVVYNYLLEPILNNIQPCFEELQFMQQHHCNVSRLCRPLFSGGLSRGNDLAQQVTYNLALAKVPNYQIYDTRRVHALVTEQTK